MTAPLHPDAMLHVSVVACDLPFPTEGDYVRRFWTSQIGPTGTLLLQLLAGEGPRQWRVGDLACRLGVSGKAANHAHNPLGRSFDRLAKFRLIENVGDGRIFVRSHLARLESHQVARMSPELQAEHAAYIDAYDSAAFGGAATLSAR